MNNEDKKRVTRRLILVCWIVLFICFIIKLCGGNYFEIMSNNERFYEFCLILEKYKINIIIKYIFYMFSLYLIISIFSKEKIKGINLLRFLMYSTILWLAKRTNALFGSILETIYMFLFPIVYIKGTKFSKLIMPYIMINILQVISLFVRNINPIIIKENFYIGLICQIDYYIMLILYYLYSVKMKGELVMDWSVLWFGDKNAMDKGYEKFLKVMTTIGVVLTFPISVPYILWKKHKANKMVKVDK